MLKPKRYTEEHKHGVVSRLGSIKGSIKDFSAFFPTIEAF